MNFAGCDKKSLLLYAVTDRSWLNGRALVHVVEQSLKGGATMIQLREKTLDYEGFLQESIAIKTLCKDSKYKIPFIINDNLDIAIASDADGIHIGQRDAKISEVRKKFGKNENKIIGVSVHTTEQAVIAEREGASYLGVGSVFSTDTKKDADNVSFDVLKSICRSVSIPVCAIGGINISNIHDLAGSGISGVAVISAIFASDDIREETRRLRLISNKLFN